MTNKKKKAAAKASMPDKDMNMQNSREQEESLKETKIETASETTNSDEKVAVENSEQDEMAVLKKELAEYKDKYLRTMAEFENFRKRSISEKAEWIRHATKELALHICDVLDNFERALNQAKTEDLESPFGKGVQLIEKQLAKTLENEGVKKIEALGCEFDPEYHDALAHIASEYEENIVAAIIQNGYTMHDKVIRPVRVAVSNGNKMNTLEE
ncbi:MAG: nucleotide exchange factor GrpE [Candidatus Cloacimonetes bacterium]|jgi:molecular chaperone GrpE|nr:nucleotide exchange factor GrpE [Candidatus Cloacimonadota bacterium]MDD2506234.1 nucleotide exchange factor GrpE [Candidatus Cloacimonadota bacterium]MDD4559635.1 nucleotide exchange factor GrpE [Candidatus Cloacimonadota bacterium]